MLELSDRFTAHSITIARMPWISTVPPEEATGRLAEAYAWQSARLGHPTEFTQLGSLEPELVHARLALYRASERASSNLTERQRTIAGHVASAVNRTPHCVSRSAIKLRELGLDGNQLAAVESGRYDVLSDDEAAIARYADKLTRDPGSDVRRRHPCSARSGTRRSRDPRPQQPDRSPELHQSGRQRARPADSRRSAITRHSRRCRREQDVRSPATDGSRPSHPRTPVVNSPTPTGPSWKSSDASRS